MLEQLIHELRAGGSLETGTLAARLGTTPQLVEAMLEHLKQNGLIQAYSSCGVGCQGCSLQEACNKQTRRTIRLWQSTSKG